MKIDDYITIKEYDPPTRMDIIWDNERFKADYETNLKAEKIAMLKDLQLEIEEMDSRAGYDGGGMPTFSTDYIRKKKVNEFIQQKINALNGKGEQWK